MVAAASTTSAAGSLGSIFQTSTPTQTDTTNKLFTDNSQMYLKLFLTQLQNQDPTQPFDTAQMTQQLAQLNSSQQEIQTNQNLEELIAQNKSSQGSSLSSFINKQIEYLGDTFYNAGGETKDFSYTVDADYKSVSIQITDSDNNVIAKYPGELAQGSQKFEWDGKDASGNPVPAGTYKISAVSEASDGTFGTLTTLIKAIVSGVDFSSSSEPVILVGNADNKIGVDLSRIASVMDVSSTGTTTN